MSLVKTDDQIVAKFPDGTILGQVNAQLERALESVYEQQYHVNFEVFAPIQPIRETISKINKEKDAIVRVHINVYGPQSMAYGVGQELSSNKIYFQRPNYVAPGFLYDNPHILKFADFQTPIKESLSEMEEDTPVQDEIQKAETFKRTVSKIYSSLTRGQSLEGLEGDDGLRTKLLPHQKQALTFMTQRESGPIPENFSLWKQSEMEGRPCVRNVITNLASYLDHKETGGGILADEMGMGKTLSVLALILLMINEWFQEIERHFHHRVHSMLSTIKYHGRHRKANPEKLCDADIIITTYHTLHSDSKEKSPLHEIEWYRLVLDEAHYIRRQSTLLNRTVSELKARSRWCLTGTPIQNRLEDIGALFAFLKIIPFNTLSTFRKYIAIPFDEGGKRHKLAIERFTRLLDSLCLRRSKDLLHLPDAQNHLREIDFSPEERRQYDQTNNMMMRAARNQVGGLDQKSTLGLFQVQLQLRILCNHGTYQQPFSWNRRKLHLIDEREAMEASMGRESEVTCSACRETMSILDTIMFRRYTENCRHVLCSECIDDSDENNLTNCPLCSTLWKQTSTHSQSHHAPVDEKYFRPQGTSSKMEALMRDVQINVNTTKR
ncbi:hypothetical protein DM02DRAFT_637872 [Periconia macrospinosa]|uniref:Helicase ATP-binding domain-containing protein n=1 Tax=Periconia macrospinosa TaxID=97972 RepID=A0A2V1EB93_9PLEO|nr:hypothetical protein DM02DRAFT_637872 [Periconia macrospinosa]